MAPPQLENFEEHVVSLPDRRLVYVARVSPITNSDFILLTDDVIIGTDAGAATGVSACVFSIDPNVNFYGTRGVSYVAGSNFYTRSNPKRVRLGNNVGKNVIVVSITKPR